MLVGEPLWVVVVVESWWFGGGGENNKLKVIGDHFEIYLDCVV